MYHCRKCNNEFEAEWEEMDFDFDKDGKLYYIKKCDKCGGDIIAGYAPDVFGGVNVCADGDFHPYFSPDLGIYVDSPKTLNDHLRKKGMVNLRESKEYRENEARMHEKAMQFPSIRNVM
jgi:NAD-dependent SIR2 family protein deacetylase